MIRCVTAAGPRRARVSRGMVIAVVTATVGAVSACGSPTTTAAPQAKAPSTSSSRTSSGSTQTSTVTSTPAAVTGSSSAAPTATAAPPTAAPSSGSSPSTPRPGTGPATAAATPAPALTTGAWRLTTTYTAVESFHTGAPQAINGCPPGADECSNGSTPLGSYPSDFLDAVRAEGAGRITSGTYSGRYLTWDADSGYAIDTAVRDDSEKPMVAYASAGGDPSLSGTAFSVLDCGVDATSSRAPSTTACSRIEGATWTVRVAARQTGDPHILELYIGEEDAPGFATSSPALLHTVGARTSLP